MQDNSSRALYRAAEHSANAFNLKCLAVLCALALATIVLNELGVFIIPQSVLLPTMLAALALFAAPIASWFVRDRLLKQPVTILEHPAFKFKILVFSFLGIALLSVSLSFHAVLILAVPPLIAAQYREDRRIALCTVIATLVLVPVSVYGGFFFGVIDRNMLKGMLTDAEAMVFANRLAIATPERMVELLTHYTVPRLFGVVAITVLTMGITKRNSAMLRKQAALAEQVQEETEQVNAMQSRMIDALATLIETRDEGTGEHVARTKEYVKMLAVEMQKDERYRAVLTDEVIDTLYNAAPLHDVGKIAISDTILLKPGKLTEEEFNTMKTHTTKGRQMIRTTFAGLNDEDFLRAAEEIAASHHEKWDGSGYPQGLKGEEIPLSARIMAVADVFDALTSVRVYKKAVTARQALEIMFDESGTHFDPSIMAVVRRLQDRLIEMAGPAPEDESGA